MGGDGVSNHQHHHSLLDRLFRRRSKKTAKLCVTGLCAGNSPVTGKFLALMASNAENVSIWWRHHELNQQQDIHAILILTYVRYWKTDTTSTYLEHSAIINTLSAILTTILNSLSWAWTQFDTPVCSNSVAQNMSKSTVWLEFHIAMHQDGATICINRSVN